MMGVYESSPIQMDLNLKKTWVSMIKPDWKWNKTWVSMNSYD